MYETLRVDLVISIIAFSVALSVSFGKGRDKQQTLLSLFSFIVAVIFLLKYVFIETSTHIWLRLSLGLLIPLPIVALFLITSFLKEENSLSIELYTIQYIFAPILIVGLSTPIFNNREFVWFTISYTLGMLSFTFINLLYIGFKEKNPAQKRRIILFSLLGLLSVLTNLFSLKLKNNTLFIGMDAFLIVLFLFYINESVLNTKLLDLQEFILKTLILILISVLLSVIYWIFAILISYRPQDMVLNSLAVSTAITLVFDRLRQSISGFISNYISARTKDFTTLIKRIRKEISLIIDADRLLRYVVDEIFSTHKVTSCAFFILSEDRSCYKNYYSLGQQVVEKIDNILDHSLIEMLNEQRQVIVKELLEKRYVQEIAQSEDGNPKLRTRDILNSLTRLNITLLFPIIIENEVIYILAVNDSGVQDSINAEELGELIELSEQISILLQNLKIFESIKERDRLAALGEMAAGLAHEIRNPLGAIKGAAQYLNPANLPQEEAEFLNIIIDETDRLNRVLSQFLDYSRPYQGEFSQVNLDSIIKQIIKFYFPEKDQRYAIEYSNTSVASLVKIDVEQFKQVIINILKNAQEAMPDGGKIDIKVYRKRQIGKKILSTVFLRDSKSSDNIFIDIIDRGVGIDERDLRKVFIPFFTTKKSGTGLGLAISRKIIESQNGKIEIQSKKGEGTTVRIMLPSIESET